MPGNTSSTTSALPPLQRPEGSANALGPRHDCSIGHGHRGAIRIAVIPGDPTIACQALRRRHFVKTKHRRPARHFESESGTIIRKRQNARRGMMAGRNTASIVSEATPIESIRRRGLGSGHREPAAGLGLRLPSGSDRSLREAGRRTRFPGLPQPRAPAGAPWLMHADKIRLHCLGCHPCLHPGSLKTC